MKSDHVEQILDDAVHQVVWGDTKPTEYVADWISGTMLTEDWNPFEMMKFELMALAARKQNGFNFPIE